MNRAGRFLIICLSLAAVLLAPGMPTTARAADVVSELIDQGVKLHSGATISLTPPKMADDLSRDQQQAALKQAAGKHPLDRFIRNSIVAPYSLDITSVDNVAVARRGQRTDFCFVAYGSLSTIIDQDLFSALAGTQEAGGEGATVTARSLTAEELQTHDLSPLKNETGEESYLYLDVPILNRVQLRGVGHAWRGKRDKSAVAGIKLDEHFAGDAKLAGTWSPLERDKRGKLSVGSPQPYGGLGGYVKITQLDEPAGALFVECHIAFDEPEAWFGGKNLLRSKLPLVVQDNVRTFRRKLGKSGE